MKRPVDGNSKDMTYLKNLFHDVTTSLAVIRDAVKGNFRYTASENKSRIDGIQWRTVITCKKLEYTGCPDLSSSSLVALQWI